MNAIARNGAGDVVHGAFALAIASGDNFGQAARFASAVAALKCTRRGGWESMPNRSEVEALLTQQAALTAKAVGDKRIEPPCGFTRGESLALVLKMRIVAAPSYQISEGVTGWGFPNRLGSDSRWRTEEVRHAHCASGRL